MKAVSEICEEIEASSTLEISTIAGRLKDEGKDVVSFAAGQPDFPTPERVIEGAVKAMEDGYTKYTPAAGMTDIRTEVAEDITEKTGVEYGCENVIISSGAKQSLANVILTLCDNGEEVIIPKPYWVSYPEQVKLARGKTVYVDTSLDNDFKLTPEQLENAISPDTKIILLNSPSNPSGAVYSLDELRDLIEVIKGSDVYLLSDEIYDKIVFDGIECPSMIEAAPTLKERIIMINGVSKAYSMTGWRIGWAIGPKNIISSAAKLQGHTTTCASSIGQKAALTALRKCDEEVEEMRSAFEERRNRAYALLSEIDGVEVNKPKGAFYIFPQISNFLGRSYNGERIKNSFELVKYLLEEVYIAPVHGSAFGMEGFLRMSFATSLEKIEQGIKRMEQALNALE